MSEARDRLLAATKRLCADVEVALLAHCDLHAPAAAPHLLARPKISFDPTLDPNASTTWVIPTATRCRATAGDQAGRVRVGVLPASTRRPTASQVVATWTQPGSLAGSPYPGATDAEVPAGASSIQVWIAPTLPVGGYTGAVRDQTGALLAPAVIYLDGLQ